MHSHTQFQNFLCFHDHLVTIVIQENKENQERREKENQERQAELDRLKREADEREESKRKKEIAERKRIEREQRIESLKKTAVGVRALETITPGVCVWTLVNISATMSVYRNLTRWM